MLISLTVIEETVEAAVANCFCDMWLLYALAVIDIRDRASQFQNAVISAGGELKFFHGSIEQGLLYGCELAIAFDFG